ncbi:hypothetical protein PMAYCL1PPCAC_19360, partial [Pristionchus mayeri]
MRDNVKNFVSKCKDDIAKGNKDQEKSLKNLMKDKMVDTLAKAVNAFNEAYLRVRKTLLFDSSNCDFLFTSVNSIGEMVCDQSLGGLNGIYASVGLAALSLISATCGTVMIWHSLRAGMNSEDGSGG